MAGNGAGRSKGGVHWKGLSEMQVKVGGFNKAMDRALTATTQYHAASARSTMRSNAPWRDQTGNARNGLNAQAFKEFGKAYGVVLYHSVSYGIFLETMQSGRFAIVGPTTISEGKAMMNTATQLMAQLGKGA